MNDNINGGGDYAAFVLAEAEAFDGLCREWWRLRGLLPLSFFKAGGPDRWAARRDADPATVAAEGAAWPRVRRSARVLLDAADRLRVDFAARHATGRHESDARSLADENNRVRLELAKLAVPAAGERDGNDRPFFDVGVFQQIAAAVADAAADARMKAAGGAVPRPPAWPEGDPRHPLRRMANELGVARRWASAECGRLTGCSRQWVVPWTGKTMTTSDWDMDVDYHGTTFRLRRAELAAVRLAVRGIPGTAASERIAPMVLAPLRRLWNLMHTAGFAEGGGDRPWTHDPEEAGEAVRDARRVLDDVREIEAGLRFAADPERIARRLAGRRWAEWHERAQVGLTLGLRLPLPDGNVPGVQAVTADDLEWHKLATDARSEATPEASPPDAGPPVEAARAEPAAVTPVGSGMSAADAKVNAERIVKAADGAWPGLNELARQVGCAKATLKKAVKDSRYLAARKAEHEAAKPRGGRTVPLSHDPADRAASDPAEAVADDEIKRLAAESRAEEEREERQRRAAEKRPQPARG